MGHVDRDVPLRLVERRLQGIHKQAGRRQDQDD